MNKLCIRKTYKISIFSLPDLITRIFYFVAHFPIILFFYS